MYPSIASKFETTSLLFCFHKNMHLFLLLPNSYSQGLQCSFQI
uniref:Uncharacterized protein n=1 Tax=Rhizophora mucronata TaxID=61149 RepID=A0A2P2IWH2_RHIMU